MKRKLLSVLSFLAIAGVALAAAVPGVIFNGTQLFSPTAVKFTGNISVSSAGQMSVLQTASNSPGETLGTQLRRLARVASKSNAWSQPYMLAVKPWQPNTTYYRYQTVVNAGQIYVCTSSSGTSAGSGGPTATNTATAQLDGGIYWTWWGQNVVTSDPSLTQNAWAASTGYSALTQVTNGGNVYACIAGTTYVFTVSGVTTTPTAGTVFTNNGHSFYVQTTSITSGSGTFTCSGTGAATSSGTLTKSSGTGDTTDSFSAVTTSSTSASSGGPSGTSNIIIDSGIVWTYMGAYRQSPYTNDFPVYSYGTSGLSGYSTLTNFYDPVNGTGISLQRALSLAAGSGYSANDVLTISGGTFALTFTVSGITTAPTNGATYTNNGITYTVQSTSISGGSGTVTATGSGNSLASGTLTKTAGTGDSTITFSAATTVVRAQIKVLTVSSGAVSTFSILTAGSYSAPPAASPGVTGGTGTGATFVCNWTTPRWCKLRGCYNAGSYSTTWAKLYTMQPTANATPYSQHCAIEFYSDTPKLYFDRSSNNLTGMSIIIDGIRYNHGELDNPAGANNYYGFDFSGTSGRKKRLWRLEFTSGPNMSGIWVDPYSTVWAPDDQDRIRAVLITDSLDYGSNYGPFIPGNSTAQRLGTELGWSDVWAFSQQGTGYVNRGSAPGTTTDMFGFRIPEALTLNPNIWVLMGSTNDIGDSGIGTNVTSLLNAIRNGGSTAPIIVYGLWCINNSGVSTVETAVQTAVAGWTDPLGLTYFVPIYGDSQGPWVTGSWNNVNNPAGVILPFANNSVTMINGGDSIHPADPGTEYLGKRMANAARTQVFTLVP